MREKLQSGRANDKLNLLVSGKYDTRAGKLSQIIRKEDGIGGAIRAIEEYV